MRESQLFNQQENDIDRLIKNQLAAQEIAHPTGGQKVRALLHNLLQFGLLFQTMWLQLVMVFPGLYTAVKLDNFIKAIALNVS